MSTTDPQSTGSSRSGPRCGNCGVAVDSSAVTCPSCGVLLAAYQSATGSSSQSSPYAGGDSSATHDTPGAGSGSTVDSSATGPSTATPGSAYQAPFPPPSASSSPSGPTPPYATPPIHQPRSQSPIGDALRTSRDGMTSSMRPDSLSASDAPAEELTRMASSEDELADMADGEDELADMASGQDELSRMASGGKATLTEQVEAELTGAKVIFDGSDPVIEAPDVTVANPGEGEPEVVEHPSPADARASAANPPKPARPTPSSSAAQRQAATPPPAATREKYRPPAIDWVDSTRPRTATHTSATVGAPPAYPDPAAKQVAVTKAALMGCLPFILIFSVITWVFQGGNAGSTFFGILIIAGIFYLLLKSAGATSRRTTHMPLDDTFKSKGRR